MALIKLDGVVWKNEYRFISTTMHEIQLQEKCSIYKQLLNLRKEKGELAWTNVTRKGFLYRTMIVQALWLMGSHEAEDVCMARILSFVKVPLYRSGIDHYQLISDRGYISSNPQTSE